MGKPSISEMRQLGEELAVRTYEEAYSWDRPSPEKWVEFISTLVDELVAVHQQTKLSRWNMKLLAAFKVAYIATLQERGVATSRAEKLAYPLVEALVGKRVSMRLL